MYNIYPFYFAPTGGEGQMLQQQTSAKRQQRINQKKFWKVLFDYTRHTMRIKPLLSMILSLVLRHKLTLKLLDPKIKHTVKQWIKLIQLTIILLLKQMHISPYVKIRMQTCQKMKPSLQTSNHARSICLAMETLQIRSYTVHTRCLTWGTYEYSAIANTTVSHCQYR